MTTTYMPVTCQIVGNLELWHTAYHSLGRQFDDRAEAHAWGVEELDHDDFRVAILVDGKLDGIGWGAGPEAITFDPVEENLADIADQLGLDLAPADTGSNSGGE